MKKIELEFQEDGIKKVIELFNTILEESEFNLNEFVKSNSVSISNQMSEGFSESLKQFVDLVPNIVKQLDDADSFWSIFENIDDYEKNDKFIMWLKKYAESVNRPFEEALFLRKIDEKVFQKLSNYCFENLILRDIGKKRINSEIGDIKQILILRKIIFTFIEMIVVDNFSKENAFDNMERMFGIKASYCEFWWDLIEKEQDKIWKIMIMKQCSRIENKLNNLLDLIEE